MDLSLKDNSEITHNSFLIFNLKIDFLVNLKFIYFTFVFLILDNQKSIDIQ